jgi:hypothetical protein
VLHRTRPRPMLRTLTAALLGAVLIASGCDSAPDLSGRPTEADKPVIYVSRFKTGDEASTRLAALPVAVLYGDGRVIRPGPRSPVRAGARASGPPGHDARWRGAWMPCWPRPARPASLARPRAPLATEADPTIDGLRRLPKRSATADDRRVAGRDRPRRPAPAAQGQARGAAMNMVVEHCSPTGLEPGRQHRQRDGLYADRGPRLVSSAAGLEPRWARRRSWSVARRPGHDR